MTPIVKDVENSTAASSPALSSSVATKNSQEHAPRSQPMPLEVQVTVNGARTVEGSDKREPFSESTKTVLVFANGAVIRLTSSVAPGQLLFVTNEKTKKEVVCQVLKSRNDGKVTGYVELEFTEPAAGFWGVRIPGESAAAPAPAGLSKPPVAPRAVAPSKIESSSRVEAPVVPTVAAPKIAIAPPAVQAASIPAALPSKPAVVAPPAAVVTTPKPEAVLPAVSTNASSSIQAELHTSTPLEVPAVSAESVKEISTEELKQQAARLQEQLNALLFRGAAAEKAPLPTLAGAPAVPAKEVNTATELAEKVLEFTEPEVKATVAAEPAKAPPATPSSLEARQTPILSKTAPISLPVEEMKIPSWLAPLARETESTSEEPSTPLDATTGTVSTLADAGTEGIFQAGAEETSQKSEAVLFGGQLLAGAATAEAPSSTSKKGLFLGLAAAALLVGGGVWYGKQPGNFLATSSIPPQATEHGRQLVNESAERTDAATTSGGASSSAPQPLSKPANSPAPVSKSTGTTLSSTTPSKTDAASTPNTTPVEEPKKPALGDVRLATPNVNRTEDSQGGEAAPSIEGSQATPSSDGLTGIAGSHTNGPVAPLPVGGDVKPAHLLKSKPPVYPATARSQRVSGDVTIDALIDASGVVTTAKVISGPAMLHQAAVAAVKQWQYEPAQLDGKPTAMHLTVTVQFRLN
jgi:TonB family protein